MEKQAEVLRHYGLDTQSEDDGPEPDLLEDNAVGVGTIKSAGKLSRSECARSGFFLDRFDKSRLSLEHQIVVEDEVQEKVQAEQERFFQSYRQVEEESQ